MIEMSAHGATYTISFRFGFANATKPWNSYDAGERLLKAETPLDEIERCMNCTHPAECCDRCDGCGNIRQRKKPGRPRKAHAAAAASI